MRTLSLALLALLAVPLTATERPNVLFIVADDFRADLGCYGSPAITPNLDRLAKRGMIFNRAYCQQSLCNPSRSSFLTGKRPDHTRIWTNGIHFRVPNPNVVTLPQHFLKNGYVTRDVGKIFHNWHTTPKGDRPSWSADEFLYYDNHGHDVAQVKGKLPKNTAIPSPRRYVDVGVWERRDVPDDAYFDGRIASEAIRVMNEIQGKPFFLAVGFWKPHAPYNAPKKYWDLYDRDSIPKLNPARPEGAPEFAFHESGEILGGPKNRVTFTDEQAAEARHGYFANISYMDAQVGKVIDELDRLKLADNTLIVFVADHGYHLGEHTLWGKTSCFEFDARVPLIIAEPRMKQAGTKTDALVELIDLFPTLSGLCGLPKLEGWDGTSLAPILADPSKRVKNAALTQHPRPAYYDRTPSKTPAAMGYSIRTPTLRYTEWREPKTGNVLAAELYDHTRDPAELKNVIHSPPNRNALAEARRELNKLAPSAK